MIPGYRKTNFLARALGPKDDAERTSLPAPRLISLKASELSPDIRPGDTAMVHLAGFVKSMDHEGNVEFAITRVLNDQQEEAEEKIYVTPPESPAP